MTSDLVYRMRTCAAALLMSRDTNEARWDAAAVAKDAADMLVEASNLLDAPEDLGEPMDMIPVAPANAVYREQLQASARQSNALNAQGAHWGGGDLPQRMFDFGAINPKPCPSCDAVDVRKVKIQGNKLMLICPRCSTSWEYAKWR